MRSTCLAILCLTSLLTGCADQPMDHDGLGLATLALNDGTPEAIGLLALLNDTSTTMDVLDHQVPLNRRAAQNLVHYRDGWDSTPGTFDDNLFETVAEVDAVPWVGPSAMNHLLAYALTEGWVPDGEDFLGVWDGVSFSVIDADATLAFVNAASHDLLDYDLALDRRAADSIVGAQPIASIETLAGLYYVGASAMNRLKDAALTPVTEPEPEPEPEVEVEPPVEPAVAPAIDFQDQFVHDEMVEIPDGSTVGVDTDIHVHGVPDATVYVIFLVDYLHDAPGELELELTSPNGDSWFFEGGDGSIREPLGWMGDPNGVWALNTVDTMTGNVGEVWGAALEISTTEPTD